MKLDDLALMVRLYFERAWGKKASGRLTKKTTHMVFPTANMGESTVISTTTEMEQVRLQVALII